MGVGRLSPESSPFGEGSATGGYCAEASTIAGGEVGFMLSGDGPARLTVARLLHGDPAPDGPGYVEEVVPWFEPQTVQLERQVLQLGSYVELPHDERLVPSDSGMFLGMWIFPTTVGRGGGWETLACKGVAGDVSYGLFLCGSGLLVGAVSVDGRTIEWCGGLEYVTPNVWQYVGIGVAPYPARMAVCQYTPGAPSSRFRTDGDVIALNWKPITSCRLHPSERPLVLGAADRAELGPSSHFNGKLGRVRAMSAGPSEELVTRAAARDVAPSDDLIAAWDFSVDIDTWTVVDTSGNGLDGVLRNAPTRGVTGPGWRGVPATLYSDSPDGYDAVHLHEDDLDDAGWAETLRLAVPTNAKVGIHALRTRHDDEEDWIPFVVASRSATSEICLVVPTLTWQAYSSNRAPFSFTEEARVDAALGLYDRHSDGSAVIVCSRRKPTRSGNPTAGIRSWGAHTIAADLYLVHWLEHLERPYDVVTDHDLHARPSHSLDAYACVILSSHPEYWTGPMRDTLDAYLAGGGRLMYLGGNGLYWVTSLHEASPWLMEVRKSGEGVGRRGDAVGAGEMEQSSSREVGGPWARRGRSPRHTLGVESAGGVFVDAQQRWGYVRLPPSYEERFSFVFRGVADDVIGDFGLNLGSAVGYEMDSAQNSAGSTGGPVVLARSAHPLFQPVVNVALSPVADMTLKVGDRGAAVFSVGSIAWSGSLSTSSYDNNVETISRNVLQRFITVPKGEPVA